MKAGVLGTVDSDFSRLEPYRGTRTVDGTDLTDQIDITGVARTADGIDINEGVAARETLQTRQSVAIEFDAIAAQDESDVVTTHTEFAVVPGDLVIVANSSGRFFYDLLEQAADVSTTRLQLDLEGVRSEFADPSVWKVGFYGRDAGAENGVLHGEDLQDDAAFGDLIANAPTNQLGMRVTADGTEYNLNLTQSGYVEAYEPGDLDTTGFVRLVREYIQPHATPVDD